MVNINTVMLGYYTDIQRMTCVLSLACLCFVSALEFGNTVNQRTVNSTLTLVSLVLAVGTAEGARSSFIRVTKNIPQNFSSIYLNFSFSTA